MPTATRIPRRIRLANITIGLTWAGPDGEFGSADDWEYPAQTTGSDGLYLFENLPPGEYRGSVDLDTVGSGMAATTPPSYEITLLPGEDFFDGDVGFAPAEEPLPLTGIDADRIGLATIMFLVLGLALLLIGGNWSCSAARAPTAALHQARLKSLGRRLRLVGDVGQVGDVGERVQRQDVGPGQ